MKQSDILMSVHLEAVHHRVLIDNLQVALAAAAAAAVAVAVAAGHSDMLVVTLSLLHILQTGLVVVCLQAVVLSQIPHSSAVPDNQFMYIVVWS